MLYKLLSNINRDKFEPTVISLTSMGEIGFQIQKLDIPVHIMSMRGLMSLPFKAIELCKLLKDLSPDLVHTWMYHADLIGGLATRIIGIRSLFWCIRNSDLSSHFSKSSTLLVVKICAKLSTFLPTKIISCSDRAKEIHIDAGYCRDKFEILPNGFNLNEFSPGATSPTIRRDLNLGSDVQIVGMFARYDLQKNHVGFIKAAAKIIRKLPKVHFLLVGNGVDCHNIELVLEIRKADLTDSFTLLGHRNDIPQLMASLDLMVSPSSWERLFQMY